MRKNLKALKKILLLICLAVLSSAAAAGKSDSGGLSRSEHQQLTSIEQQLQAGHWQQALQKLLAFAGRKPSAYGGALSQQLLAGIYQQQQQLQAAFLSYRLSYQYRYWPVKARAELQVKLYKLKYALKDWQGSIDWLLLYQQSNRLSAVDYMLLANSYVQLQQPTAAKGAVQQALALRGRAPLAWRQMLLQLEGQLQHHSHQQAQLKQLLLEYPQKQRYWLLLAKSYQSQQRTEEATATLHSAFIGRVLINPTAIYWLAASLRDQGSPISAVTVIQQGLQRGALNDLDRAKSFIAHGYLMAREPAANQALP